MAAKLPLVVGPGGQPHEISGADYLDPVALPTELLDINTAADANEFVPLTTGGDDFRLLTGDDNGDYIGTPLSTLLRGILGTETQGSVRSQLGLGTSATENTGTSGAVVPLLNGANNHSGKATFSATASGGSDATVTLSHATGAQLGFNISGQGSDGKNWDIAAAGTQFNFRVVNDANNSAPTWLRATRSGATVTSVEVFTGGTQRALFDANGCTVPAFTCTGAEAHTGILSPTQITANTDNYAPTGHAAARVFRLSTDASRNLTGLQGGTSGRRITISNVGAQNLVLVHDLTSTAANRFLCPGSASFTLNANDSVDCWYDATSSRWRVVAF